MKKKTFFVDGYFSERDVTAIKAALHGKTIYRWEITAGNYAGNYTICIATEYPEGITKIKGAFLHHALTALSDYYRMSSK